MKILIDTNSTEPYLTKIIDLIQNRLIELNIDVVNLSTVENSTSLLRYKLANQLAKSENCTLIVINLSNYCDIIVSPNACSYSRKLATLLAINIKSMLQFTHNCKYYQETNLTVFKNTSMPTVLVNLEIGNDCELIIKGICDYLGIAYDR